MNAINAAEKIDAISNLLAINISSDKALKLAQEIFHGAMRGGELDDFDEWLENRFTPNLVWLNPDDYTKAIASALPRTLYLSNKRKGKGFVQLWTDTARGLLGEIAVQRFFSEKLNLEIRQDISMDSDLDDYISTDIKFVRDSIGEYRPTRINTSVKTGKFNARWLDEYSAPKIANIDAFIFVRLGTPREHFVAYLKDISFLKTKLFPKAVELGELTNDSSAELWDSIPDFELIPAYIPGFLMRRELNYPIHSVTPLLLGQENYRGNRDTRRIRIKKGVGVFTRANLYAMPEIQKLDPEQKLDMIIDGIEKLVDDKDHFYANTGAFSHGVEDWKKFRTRL